MRGVVYLTSSKIHSASFDFLSLQEIKSDAPIREVTSMRESVTQKALTR